jgi:hypothetical protein
MRATRRCEAVAAGSGFKVWRRSGGPPARGSGATRAARHEEASGGAYCSGDRRRRLNSDGDRRLGTPTAAELGGRLGSAAVCYAGGDAGLGRARGGLGPRL